MMSADVQCLCRQPFENLLEVSVSGNFRMPRTLGAARRGIDSFEGVSSAAALYAAVLGGAADIKITKHLDLSGLGQLNTIALKRLRSIRVLFLEFLLLPPLFFCYFQILLPQQTFLFPRGVYVRQSFEK